MSLKLFERCKHVYFDFLWKHYATKGELRKAEHTYMGTYNVDYEEAVKAVNIYIELTQ